MPEDYHVSPHFLRSEVECHHCHKVGPYDKNMEKMLELLEKLRAEIGNRPIDITCLYRCRAHNSTIPGASRTSKHLEARAGDIHVHGMHHSDLAKAAWKVGFTDVGDYLKSQFVHVGIAPVGRWTKDG